MTTKRQRKQQARKIHRDAVKEEASETIRNMRTFKGLLLNRATRRAVNPFDKETWKQH